MILYFYWMSVLAIVRSALMFAWNKPDLQAADIRSLFEGMVFVLVFWSMTFALLIGMIYSIIDAFLQFYLFTLHHASLAWWFVRDKRSGKWRC